jgi:DnaJ-class molecular chaperone
MEKKRWHKGVICKDCSGKGSVKMNGVFVRCEKCFGNGWVKNVH